MKTRRHLLLTGLLMAAAAQLAAQPFDPRLLADVHWRLAGPFRGGRVLAVAGVPGRARALLLRRGRRRRVGERRTPGAPGSRSSTASPSRRSARSRSRRRIPSVIYVGSGEADMRSDISHGNGMYRSRGRRQDVGATSASRTRGRSGASSSIRATPNLVFVAALGHAYGPERRARRLPLEGRRRDLAARALQGREHRRDRPRVRARRTRRRSSPRSGRRGVRRGTSTRPRTGPGSGLYRSEDGGDTWTPVAGRLPVREARSHRPRVRARATRAACTRSSTRRQGGLYALDDGGATLDARERATRASGSAAGTSAA